MTGHKPRPLTEDSPSVQAHFTIIQSVIQRMAANSVSCKAWCVTMVSAILILMADKSRPNLVWIALLPSIVFGILDGYYLGLEKQFRASYDSFVRKLHRDELTSDDLFHVAPKGDASKHQWGAFKSFSVWGFYASLLALAMAVFFLLVTPK